MSPQAFDAVCKALPGAHMDVQWGDDHVWKVGGKMFAVRSPAGSFSFKASDIAFEALTAEGPGVPAPYLAKARWVWFASVEEADEEELEDWLRTAHRLIAAKLTKKVRRDLGID